jgi:pectinesterase
MKFQKLVFVGFLLFISIIGSAQNDTKYQMVVAKDGSGDYTTIQAAIDATKAFPDKRITIFIRNGVYKEKVRIPSWNNLLSIIGEDVEKTIITYNDYFNKIARGRNSTFFTYTFLVEADDFYAENLTIENSAGEVGQAVALHVEGNRCVIKNCRILGNQDTLYLAGESSHQFFKGCYIEGTTDFIFGEATALFNDCTIFSKKDSYITAASTTKDKQYGFVFQGCKLVSSRGITKVYLGRPWREYAKTVFINCFMDSQILPEGWRKWSNLKAENTTYYAEYGNSGPSAKTSARVGWSHILLKKEAKKYTPQNILGNWVEPYLNN